MTLPIFRVSGHQSSTPQASPTTLDFMMVGKSSCLLALGLLLISCDQASPSSQSSSSRFAQQPVAQRRVVQPSQRRERRMARPVSPIDQPQADYEPYKQVQPEMTLAEVQAILGSPGQYYELNDSELTTGTAEMVEADSLSEGRSAGYAAKRYVPESNDSETLFWRWTHPSQTYNIHLRLKRVGAERDRLVVQAKWLTYNPPGPNTIADARA